MFLSSGLMREMSLMNRKFALVSVLLLLLVVPLGVSLAQDATPEATAEATAAVLDLSGVKTFLIGTSTALKDGAVQLQQDSNSFYDLAKAANFDYSALWQNNQDQVTKLIQTIQADWIAISPIYEKMEGI